MSEAERRVTQVTRLDTRNGGRDGAENSGRDDVGGGRGGVVDGRDDVGGGDPVVGGREVIGGGDPVVGGGEVVDGRDAVVDGGNPVVGGRDGAAGDDRFGSGMADQLVRRLFAVGLDLHAALAYIEAHIAEHTAVEKIHDAIGGLDDAIKDFRGVVFGLAPEEQTGSGSLRTRLVEAVERACGSSGPCPGLTLGSGLESVTDDATSQQIARLVHRVLALVPSDHLSSAHVAVTTDPLATDRLVIRIDAPVYGTADVAAQVGTMGGQSMEITCQSVARSPPAPTSAWNAAPESADADLLAWHPIHLRPDPTSA